jgi:hypothetical protein
MEYLPICYRWDEVSARLDAAGIDEICERIASGETVRGVSRSLGVDDALMHRWFTRDPERTKRYWAAKVLQADAFATDSVSIADETLPKTVFGQIDSGAVQQAKLRIDTRKWFASRLKPQVYGDKLDLTVKNELTPEQVDARILALLRKTKLLEVDDESDGSDT